MAFPQMTKAGFARLPRAMQRDGLALMREAGWSGAALTKMTGLSRSRLAEIECCAVPFSREAHQLRMRGEDDEK